ncbi:MAG: hypothetical protein E6J42_01175 [Chloroflexi bacterium]|nr:MAG: hypothetical protein E6J42_01175 [Chloroflexota bacterium]
MEKKLKHLEFIQQAINRMASNLFLLKGWTVTLITAMFALAARESKDLYFAVAYFPTLMFWLLDGYFLSQERRFRSLYDHVIKLDESAIDFSMDTEPFKVTPPRNKWFHALFSSTLLIYYGVLMAAMTTVWWLVR